MLGGKKPTMMESLIKNIRSNGERGRGYPADGAEVIWRELSQIPPTALMSLNVAMATNHLFFDVT